MVVSHMGENRPAMRLLLIDSEPELARTLRDRLAASCAGGRIEQAMGLEEAGEIMRSSPPDAVLAAPACLGAKSLPEAASRLAALAPGRPLILLQDDAAGAGPDGPMLAGGAVLAERRPGTVPLLLRLLDEIRERERLARLHRKAAQARHDAELLLSGVLGVSHDALAVTDEEGRIMLANAALARLVRRAAGELAGLPLLAVLRPEQGLDRSEALAWRELAEGTREDAGAWRIVLPDALRGPLAASWRRLRLDGERSCFVFAFRRAIATSASRAPPATAADPGQLAARLRVLHDRPLERVPVARLRLLAWSRARSVLAGAVAAIEAELLRVVTRRLAADLGEEDGWAMAAEDTVVLCLPETEIRPAVRRIGLLARALEADLLASAELAQRLGDIEALFLLEEDRAFGSVETAVVALELSDEEIAEGDAAALLLRRIAQAEQELGPAALQALNELQRASTGELGLVQARNGEPSSLSLLRLDPVETARLEQLRQAGPQSPELLLELDLLLLDEVGRCLRQEVDRDSVIVVLEVSFAVLSQRRLLERYLAACRRLPPDIQRCLAFNLIGVPPGAYGPKLGRALAPLQELSRLRAITVTDPRAALVDLGAARVALVVMRHADLALLIQARPDQVQALLRRIHSHGARLLLRDVPRATAPGLRDRFDIDLSAIG